MRLFGKRRARRLAERDLFRQLRRLADEDVTVLGEQVAGLHLETMTTTLDADAQADYQRALETYDAAKRALAIADSTAELGVVNSLLDDGRFARACVLARRDGVDLPTRREPCFFNPQHGPAVTDMSWTPPGGVERPVPVCGADARRLEQGHDPDFRLVRVGDRYVPWHESERQRSMLGAAVGTEAVTGVPKYVMLMADIDRAAENIRGF